MESEDSTTGAVHCSGSLSLDLPPGVAVVGGRRTLTADVDYSVQQAADGSGPVVFLSNADAIITPLATLARVAQPAPVSPTAATRGECALRHGQLTAAIAPARTSIRGAPAAPAYCANARTRGEIAVCGDAGLAALDRSDGHRIWPRIRGSHARASARCCGRPRTASTPIAIAARTGSASPRLMPGAMREIRDIVEGRWQRPISVDKWRVVAFLMRECIP